MEGGVIHTEGNYEFVGGAGLHDFFSGRLQSFRFIAAENVLLGFREAEIIQQHLVKAHFLQFQHHGGDPGDGGGVGGIQPVHSALVHPQSRPAEHIQAAGNVVFAVGAVPEGADPGNLIEALFLNTIQ